MDLTKSFGRFYTAVDVAGGCVVRGRVDRVDFGVELKEGTEANVLYLKGVDVPDKGLILKKTIVEQLKAQCGTAESSVWIGKEMELYEAETTFAGKPVKCVRARFV